MLIPTLLFLVQVADSPQVAAAVARGIDAGAFPGAVVVIGTADRVLYAKGFGQPQGGSWRNIE